LEETLPIFANLLPLSPRTENGGSTVLYSGSFFQSCCTYKFTIPLSFVTFVQKPNMNSGGGGGGGSSGGTCFLQP